MAKKQWVNLPSEDSSTVKKATFVGDGVDSADVMGRKVYIEASFDKKDATTIATLEVKPDGGNAVYEPEESKLAHDKTATAKISDEGKAKWEVKLSAAGGDKFKFAVEHQGKKKDLPDEFETHRRLFFQVIEMTGVTGLTSFGFWETEFKKNKREISLVKIASKGAIDRSYNFDYKGSEYSRLFNLAKDKYSDAKDPYCFALVWADCLAQGPTEKVIEKTGVSKASGSVVVPLGGGQLWKNIDKASTAAPWNKMIAFIYTKDGSEQTFPIPDPDVTSTYTEITVNTRNFPEGVTGKIKAKVNVATGFHGGWSFPTQNIIVIATRGWYDTAYSDTKKRAILIHESGHKIGMVPDGTGGLKEQSTYDKVHDPSKNSHCNDNSCTMWWTTTFEKDTFCGVCDKSVRKVDLYAPGLKGFTRFF
jgi:hypothetical protein